MKKLLLVTMLAIGLGTVAACNRDTAPGAPNRVNPPDRSAPPMAQNPNRSIPPAASSTSPRPGQGTASQVAELSFESVDINKDGVVTPNEALTVEGLDFASADTDNSHTLSRQEFAAAMAKARPGG
jgi:hypothetical protein